MRTHYVTRPRGWVSATHEPEQAPTVTVVEPDRQPVDTGLLDATGTRLWRVEEPEPMGFRVNGIRVGEAMEV